MYMLVDSVTIPISIHALREEGDISPGYGFLVRDNFYPRPPRGGRPALWTQRLAPRYYFYPRPPRGGRHARSFCQIRFSRFLSTPSARRATSAIQRHTS